MKPVLEIDGRNFDTLDGFFAEVDRALVTASWGHNLDAFNDILRGGFGTPDGGFVLRWLHSAVSRAALGHAETARVLALRATRCHPTNVPRITLELEAARRGEGSTIFEELVEIIEVHGPNGLESEDGVDLELA